MVETLIFESPVQEEPEPSPIPENGISLTNGCDKEWVILFLNNYIYIGIWYDKIVIFLTSAKSDTFRTL